MTAGKTRRALFFATATSIGIVQTCPATAQDISLNYESLSSLEGPLATEIGYMTFVLTGLLDTPLTLDLEDDDGTDAGFIGNFQISALTQLSNRWRVALTYFGQYVNGQTLVFELGDDDYEDNAALSAGGAWGTVLGGNVSGIVREQTRRLRGAGNASLDFDDVLGMLEDRSAGYVGRFGPWVMSTVVDEDANFDLGAMY